MVGIQFIVGTPANRYLRLGPITPTYDCWWPVSMNCLMRVGDQQWLRAVVALWLTLGDYITPKPDADGQTTMNGGLMHHAGSADWNGLSMSGQFKLVAGQTYALVAAVSGVTGGTWAYYQGPYAWINSPGVIPR